MAKLRRMAAVAALLLVVATLALLVTAETDRCDDCQAGGCIACCPFGCAACACCGSASPLAETVAAGATAPALAGFAAALADSHPSSPAPRGVRHVPKPPPV